MDYETIKELAVPIISSRKGNRSYPPELVSKEQCVEVVDPTGEYGEILNHFDNDR